MPSPAPKNAFVGTGEAMTLEMPPFLGPVHGVTRPLKRAF